MNITYGTEGTLTTWYIIQGALLLRKISQQMQNRPMYVGHLVWHHSARKYSSMKTQDLFIQVIGRSMHCRPSGGLRVDKVTKTHQWKCLYFILEHANRRWTTMKLSLWLGCKLSALCLSHKLHLNLYVIPTIWLITFSMLFLRLLQNPI